MAPTTSQIATPMNAIQAKKMNQRPDDFAGRIRG
jgi:hypothetical protein